MDSAYQLIVPALAPAVNDTVPASHREAAVVELIVGKAFTIIAPEAVVVVIAHVPETIQ